MIEISDEETRKCFKYQHNLYGSLNITYNASNSSMCLWNKYQIFIHERLNFKDAANILIPEFQIKQTLLVDNYLLCLDLEENIYVISLKFKHSAAKRLKSNFSLRDQNILRIREIGNDVVGIKIEADSCFICTYRISSDFRPIRKQKINSNDINIEKDKCVLFSHRLTEQEFDSVKGIFHCNNSPWKDHFMLIFSLDKKILYGCLYSVQSDNELNFVKLYTCPTEISDVKIINKNHPEIIIALASGTLIILTANTGKSCKLVHMNTCIDKFIELDDSIIYSDGCNMWKANHILENITFKQLLVKQPKDFTKCSDQIICTTYTNFIYILSLDDESSELKPMHEPDHEYSSATVLLNNTQYLEQTVVEAKKMEILLKKLSMEKNCITTIAISNKQDLMDNIVRYEVSIFDNYEDILKEDKVLIFADEPKDIFKTELYYFLITIKTAHINDKFKDILSHLFGDLRIHITLLTKNNILKTTTIKVLEELKKINIVITAKNNLLDFKADIFINIKLVTKIPGVLDVKQGLWTCLHEKCIPLTSEQFIQTNKSSRHVFFKQNHGPLEDLILHNSQNQFGALFNIIKNSTKLKNEWMYYIKLPINYKNIFRSELGLSKSLSNFNQIRNQLSSREFLELQNAINFRIANNKFEIKIVNDGFSNPILKVSSVNNKVAFDMRNFFSNMLYKNFQASQSQDMVVNWSLFSMIETLQKSVQECVNEGCELEEILDLHHTFQRNIVGNLPI